jgi:LysM domain
VAVNALPAVELTCESELRPRRGEAGRDDDAEVLPFPAPHPRAPHPVTSHPGAPQPAAARPRAPHQASLRPDVPPVPLRLTRRGRLVLAALAALLVTVVSLLAANAAQATNHALPPGAARQDLVQVVVGPGQSLWSVAESTDPDQDTRAVVQQIVEINGLSSDMVFAGQQLWVPRG